MEVSLFISNSNFFYENQVFVYIYNSGLPWSRYY